MFAPLGLFKDIPCPQGQECSLLACVFSHHDIGPGSQDIYPANAQAQEPGEAAEPASKRIKVEPPIENQEALKMARPHGHSGVSSALRNTPIQKLETPATKAAERPNSSQEPAISKTGLAKRGMSTGETPESSVRTRQAPKEALNPRMLAKAPATYNTRAVILKKLHSTLCSLNDKLTRDGKFSDKALILTPDELITMALDEEEKAAKDNPTIYSNIVKLRIVKLSKLSQEEWAKELKDYLNRKYYKLKPNQVPKEPKRFTSGLSVEEEIAIVKKLVTPLQGLEEYGYVTKAPTVEEIDAARKGVLESKGWEKCDRCGGRFQVFPGRRGDGSLTTGGPCTHHPGKSFYPPRKKTDHVTGAREAYFTCCNETLGTSAGCTKGETHVFKVSETKRLASILQFEETPENPDKGRTPPICFDCEMGYTTLGLELIRMTAVTWPQGEKILDVLVRPIGEVLDLNSRFSGVFPEHYTKALPYSAPTSKGVPKESDEARSESVSLEVVESPAAARALLFRLLQPTTPLIGHAIDNDLNACRIIHPTVIDTAILYPHPAGGFPYRMSLRTLSKKHLDRDIQTGGSRGHDSKEDAIATGDLVRAKAAEVWKTLKSRGWTVVDGTLVPPPGQEDDTTFLQLKLGQGSGQKRTSSTKE
ncbi:putative RNA exonuclease Rex3 [Aspergillus lucknowensis]|uniref:Exonuclease domain-containing protein n=1 Tax=Aspergillus lucknowensis TaxID=176173 RepID=A0ABR4LUZ1_9EURO